MRIRSTSFSAGKTLTKDTVPVNVDAILFWVVTDAKKAIVEVEKYETTVSLGGADGAVRRDRAHRAGTDDL